MSTDLRPALIGSALVHAGLVLAGVWNWMERDPPPPTPASVPVMLVSAPPGVAPAPDPSGPVAEFAPSSPASAPPEPAPPEPSPPVLTPPTPSPPVVRPAPVTPAKPTPAPPKAAAPTAKPTTAKPPPAKPAPARPAPVKSPPPATPSLDLGALKNRLARNSARSAPAASSPGISAADLQAAQGRLVARLQELWRPNCEAEGGSSVKVQVRFTLSANGRVQGDPSVVGGFAGDALTRAAQERAVRAVLAGQPYDWLPAEALGVSYAPRFNAEQACAG